MLRDGCFIKAFLPAVYVIHNVCGLGMMFNTHPTPHEDKV